MLLNISCLFKFLDDLRFFRFFHNDKVNFNVRFGVRCDILFVREEKKQKGRILPAKRFF